MNRGATGLLLALLVASGSARAQPSVPQAARAVRIDEHIGTQVPRALVFVTPEGAPEPLAQVVRGDLPVLLVLAYARCKMLCSVVLQSATKLVRELPDLQPGRDYRPLLVGLDPAQTLEEARRHRDALLARIGGPADPARFPYLLGKQPQVAALADAVGFRYAWDARTEQYAHPAVLIVLDREGRVFRYLHALGTTPEELSAALRAARGERAPVAEEAHASLAGDLLRCFRFDPALRRHREAITLYFRVGGTVIFVMLSGLVLGLLARERRRRA